MNIQCVQLKSYIRKSLFSHLVSAQDLPEFRSIFIATVDNIDWPAYGGQDSKLQKADMIQYLDTVEGMNSNAVMFQVILIIATK